MEGGAARRGKKRAHRRARMITMHVHASVSHGKGKGKSGEPNERGKEVAKTYQTVCHGSDSMLKIANIDFFLNEIYSSAITLTISYVSV